MKDAERGLLPRGTLGSVEEGASVQLFENGGRAECKWLTMMTH